MHHLFFPRSRQGDTYGAAGYKETNRLPRRLKKRLKQQIKDEMVRLYTNYTPKDVRTDWIRLIQVWYSDVWKMWRTNHQYRSSKKPWPKSKYHSQPVTIA